jgi:hypothetical protein
MKKLFYRFVTRRSFEKLFSMQARVEERRRVMFAKSSVFAVVALAAFVSLGAFLFPQVVQAQCIWDCDLGSDPNFNPWGNSPQALDIAYCLDRDCVLNLRDGNDNLIFTGNSIPTPQVKQDLSSTDPCPASPDFITTDVTISGNVVALLRDTTGNPDPNSAANADLKIVIKGVKCSSGAPGGITLSRVVQLNELQTNVFGEDSRITIKAPTTSTPANLPALGWTGCTTDRKTGKLLSDCPFPLGTVVYKKLTDRDAQLPLTSFYVAGEVYRAVETSTTTPRQVGVRDCKGDANSTNPSTITCTRGSTVAVGGGESVALFTFPGNVAGADNHTLNENGTNVPVTVGPTSFFENIDFTTAIITASANGPEVALTGCFTQDNLQMVKCSLSAQALLPDGCTKNQPVPILVQGDLVIGSTTFRFVARDAPKCAN